MRTPPSAKKPVVQGQYNRNGYEVWLGGHVVYSAGNHARDSMQPGWSKVERLLLKTIRQFCIKTAREIAAELNGLFAGVERVAEDQ
jgi:hypothetical protein